LLAIQKEIRHTVAMQLKMDENAAMDTLMEATLTAVKDKSGYSDDYIKAATIYEVINYDPISSANSKFEGKTE
jgi:hypothetical protein